MKKYNPAKFIFGFLGIATFASLVGTISGTLAWYAYSTRATLSYSGTSVLNTVQLQIGIASENQITSYDPEEMTEEVIDGNYYYFAPVGTDLTSNLINTYLEANGYATNYLVPVTSGSYKRGDTFVLKESINDIVWTSVQPAKKNYYATIPFAFRVMRSNSASSNDFVEGTELWITDAQVRASDPVDDVDNGEAYRAIRMYVDRGSDYEDDFILNPSAQEKGATKVGGLLDLSRDGYYDFRMDEFGVENEILYGEYESLSGLSTTGYTGVDEMIDINGSGAADFDTFTAKHHQNVNYYENLDDCVIKTAEYESFSSIAPIKNESTGFLSNRDQEHPTSVCKTAGAAGHYLGRVDFTIYLEGWDFSLVDEEWEHYFDMGLQFEINQVRNG